MTTHIAPSFIYFPRKLFVGEEYCAKGFDRIKDKPRSLPLLLSVARDLLLRIIFLDRVKYRKPLVDSIFV